MKKRRRWLLVLLWTASLGSLPGSLHSQETVDFTTWLNQRVDEVVAARLNQSSASNQTEAPSVGRSSMTLVDHSSASDLVGIALTPPAFPRRSGDEAESSSLAFSITPYTFLSAVLGIRPDQPFLYQNSTAWRRFSLTLGLEEETAGESADVDRSILVGFKLKVWNPRHVEANNPKVRALRTQLGVAGAAFGVLETAIQDTLYEHLRASLTGVSKTQFLNSLSQPEAFQNYLNLLGKDTQQRIVALIESSVEPFLTLNQQTRDVVADLRGAPQISLNFQSRIGEALRDEFELTATLDYALEARVHWTFNGGLRIREASDSLEEQTGGTVATELAFQLGPESFDGRKPMDFSLGAEGVFMDEPGNLVRLQAKLTVPIVDGIDIPISATWANRTDLVDEDEVLGRFGFTIDTSRLAAALR